MSEPTDAAWTESLASRPNPTARKALAEDVCRSTGLSSLMALEVVDAVLAAGWRPPADQHAEHATATRQVAAVRALHRHWYEVDGVRHDFTVTVCGADMPADHVCRISHGLWGCRPDRDDPDSAEHEVLACYECRAVSEDGEPVSLLWPCPTIRALDALDDQGAAVERDAEVAAAAPTTGVINNGRNDT